MPAAHAAGQSRATIPMSTPERAPMTSHILPTAGTMLGICTTLIGLAKLHEHNKGPVGIDEHAGLVAILFLISALASYVSIRTAARPRFSRTCERIADASFVVGLFALAIVSFVFAYEML